MSEKKFTPGPWSVVDDYSGYIEVHGPSFKISAVLIATDLDEKDFQVCTNDAALIASAPDLYDALEEILYLETALRRITNIDRIRDLRWEQGERNAKAALAKARGEK